MSQLERQPASSSQRMAEYRARMRAAGLRPVQIWLPDTRAAGFAEACRRQASAISASDPAGEELQRFLDAVSDWPAR